MGTMWLFNFLFNYYYEAMVYMTARAAARLTESQNSPQGRGRDTGKEGWFRSNKERRSQGKHFG